MRETSNALGETVAKLDIDDVEVKFIVNKSSIDYNIKS